jgi:hypothetical protein
MSSGWSLLMAWLGLGLLLCCAAAAGGKESGSAAAEKNDHWPPVTALTGRAADAKGGAVLLLGPARMPVYLQGMAAWPEDGHGKRQTVRGYIVRRQHIPEAHRDKGGAWSQGVAPGSGPQWVVLEPQLGPEPGVPAAMPLELMAAGWPDRAACLKAIAAALEDIEDYRVAFDERPKGKKAVFELWHRAVFKPENRMMLGNPGGQCRNAICELESGKVERFLYWQ